MNYAAIFTFLVAIVPVHPPIAVGPVAVFPNPPPPARIDLHFQLAQEAFVRDAGHPAPKAVRELLDQAGSPDWRIRQRASRDLLVTEPRLVMWGLWSPDPEVHLRCNNALRFMTRCHLCSDLWKCPFQPLDFEPTMCFLCGDSEAAHGPRCDVCGNRGSTWGHKAFEVRR